MLGILVNTKTIKCQARAFIFGQTELNMKETFSTIKCMAWEQKITKMEIFIKENFLKISYKVKEFTLGKTETGNKFDLNSKNKINLKFYI